MEEVLEFLQQQQVEVMWGPVTRHATTSVYVFDPDGVHVELRLPVVMATAERPAQPAAAR